MDLAKATKRANGFWLIGLLLGIFHAIRNLLAAAKEEATLFLQKSRVGQEGGMDEAKFKETLAKIKAKRVTN